MKEPIAVKSAMKAQFWVTSEMKAIIHSESICRDLVPLSLCHVTVMGVGSKAGPAQSREVSLRSPTKWGPSKCYTHSVSINTK